MAKHYGTGQLRLDGRRLWARAGMPRHGVRLLVFISLLLGCTGIVAPGAAQASPLNTPGSTWTIEPTPNPAGAGVNVLSAVSCGSGRGCTAVGSYAANLAGSPSALAERWNGKTWRIQPAAKPEGATGSGFFGVSCASANACTAVGSTTRNGGRSSMNLAEAWNGTGWRVQAVPTPEGATDSALYAVSCTSRRACTAVGHYGNAAGLVRAVVERMNGKAWSVQPIPRPSKLTWLYGVSCSTARACTAVGYQSNGTGDAQPFAEAWNGRKWRVQAIPLPQGAPGAALSAVSCTSPDACTATGTALDVSSPTLAVRWNGKLWRLQPTPNPANAHESPTPATLDGVSCASARTCTASGEYSPSGLGAYFVEAWNGRNWRLQGTPVPAGFVHGTLFGMSCHRGRCTAVGGWTGGALLQASLAMAN